MATTLRSQVSLANNSGLPVDVITNTWHWQSNATDFLTDVSFAHSFLAAFYAQIEEIYGNQISGDYVIKTYNLLDGVPRVPQGEYTDSINPSTGTPLPNEVAICMSYHAAPISGTFQGRRRGRIFLGPLDGSVLDDTSHDGVIQATTQSTIANAGATLYAAANATSCKWAVFSPTNAGGGPTFSAPQLAASTFPVVNGHVDNAFDTIRSRGTAASTREPFF